jgi:diguanylate cyclase (GGDEF)-like protein
MKKVFIISLFTINLLSDVLRVGIYENPPKIYFDTHNQPQGIYVALLKDFAREHNHTLAYVTCQWDACLNQLSANEIDIMPDVAKTPQREERFTFSKEVILSSWSVVYRNKAVKIDSVLDLDGKSVVLLKNSIQSNTIRQYTQKFSITPRFIEVNSFDAIFKLNESVDAFITNRFYTHDAIKQKDYIATEILIEPSIITFAFNQQSAFRFQNEFDDYVHQLKKNPNSLYYKELASLLESQSKYDIPLWLKYSALATLTLVIVLMLIIVVFKILLRRKQDEIEKSMLLDSLTRLSSRYKLTEDLKRFPKANLAILNIDNFREINDFFGYQFGDAIIKEIAKRMQVILANYEYQELYHLQGDEFAVLSSEETQEHFIHAINEILLQINAKNFHVMKEEISLQFTAGISCGQDHAILLATADIALKQAKKDRKNLSYYKEDAKTTQQYESNLLWTKKVKNAINENRIIVYYQPIIQNSTKKCLKYESLVRMIDTNQEVILPAQFLEIAKRTKHYIKLTQIVVEKSFKTFEHLPYEFAINLTIEDILDEDFTLFLFSKIAAYNNPSRVTFEIVESEGIENFEEVVGFIKKLKSYGCKIAIDDFGTGYSNFEYLIHLQADIIKIDGSLIRHIHDNVNVKAVVKTIVSFAKSMQMQTIAEFVADEEIFMACKDLEIEFSQGYYFSKPLTEPSYKSM